MAYRYDSLDLNLLRVFLISLIWRMHITDRPMFSAVKLSELQSDAFRIATLEKDPLALPELDFVLTKFDNRDMGILGPTNLHFKGVRGYRINFPGYRIWAKNDTQRIPEEFDEIALSTGEPLHMLASKFHKSQEFKAMLTLAMKHPSHF